MAAMCPNIMGQDKNGKEEKEQPMHGNKNRDPKKGNINDQTFHGMERKRSRGARP